MGRVKTRKGQVPSFSQQPQFPFMQPMMHPMMHPMPQQPAPNEKDDDSSDASDGPAGKKRKVQRIKDEKALCNSSHTLIQLPIMRLQQVVEVVDSSWDNVATEDLSPEDLSRIIWMFTDIKPSAKVHKYKVVNYKELCVKFDNAVQRVVQIKGQVMIDDMKRQVFNMKSESIRDVSAKMGFIMEWVVDATRKPGKSMRSKELEHDQTSLDQFVVPPAAYRMLALPPVPEHLRDWAEVPATPTASVPRTLSYAEEPAASIAPVSRDLPRQWTRTSFGSGAISPAPIAEEAAAPTDQFWKWSSSGREWDGERGGNSWHHEAIFRSQC